MDLRATAKAQQRATRSRRPRTPQPAVPPGARRRRVCRDAPISACPAPSRTYATWTAGDPVGHLPRTSLHPLASVSLGLLRFGTYAPRIGAGRQPTGAPESLPRLHGSLWPTQARLSRPDRSARRSASGAHGDAAQHRPRQDDCTPNRTIGARRPTPTAHPSRPRNRRSAWSLLGVAPSNPSPTVIVAVYLAGWPWRGGGRCAPLGFRSLRAA